MRNLLARRKFLQAAGTAVACTITTGSYSFGAVTPDRRPRLLTGCCAYSYGKYLGSGKMTMEDFFLRAVELGVEGVDVTTYWLKSTEPAYLHNLRRLAFRSGLPFSGTAIRGQMCQPDAAQRQTEVDNIRKWVDATALLGASHVRVVGGKVPKGATQAQTIEWTAETMKAACDYAGEKGITLGIESHPGVPDRASKVIAILREVNSPYAGCNLDFSNFDDDPYTQTQALLPYATHVHVRDHYGPQSFPLDLDRIWQIFAKGGYQGFMSVEYEGDEDPMTGVPKLVSKVKALCRKYSSV